MHHLPLPSFLLALSLTACAGDSEAPGSGGSEGSDDTAGSSEGGSDDGGSDDGGSDGGSDDGGSGGDTELRDPGTPTFSAQLGGSWTGEPGYFLDMAQSALVAKQDESAVQLKIVLSGHVLDGGTLALASVQWSRADYVDPSTDFLFTASGDGSQTFTVEAWDAEDGADHIWGSMEGSIDLKDQDGGADVTLSGLVLESWPAFGS